MQFQFRDVAFGAETLKTSEGEVYRIQCRHLPTGKSVIRMGQNYNVVRLRAYNGLKKMVESDATQDDLGQLTG